MTADHLKGLEEFEAGLWKIADTLSDAEQKLIAADVYAHVWQQAVSDGISART